MNERILQQLRNDNLEDVAEHIESQQEEIERLRAGIQRIADTGRPSSFDKALYQLLAQENSRE